MHIKIDSLLDGAKRAKGVTVIIDVFRASTTAAFVLQNGAKRILPVATAEEGLLLHQKHPDYISIGEHRGAKLCGFNYGNSPSDIAGVDFTDKTVILKTTNGTSGILAAAGNAQTILFGCFVNAKATVEYIIQHQSQIVTLVGMGTKGCQSVEDDLCAYFLKAMLEGKTLDFATITQFIKVSATAQPFFDQNKPEFPEQDFYYAMQLSKFSFTMFVEKNGKQLEIKKR